jgi:spore coat protein H
MKISNRFIICSLIAVYAFSCKDKEAATPDRGNLADWTEATHGKAAEPNYSVVFPQNQVNTLEIRMTKDDWANIRADMKIIKGGDFGVAGGMGGGVNSSSEPKYVAVSMKFNGKEWYKVGFRLKGNSSLSSIWRAGIYKLPFRLKMDEFEDQYAEIQDQFQRTLSVTGF